MPWLKSTGGVERVVLGLLEDKRHDIDVYTFDYQKERTFEDFKKYRVYDIGKLKGGSFLTKGLGLFLNMLFSKIENLEKYDVFMISTAGIAELAVFRNRHERTVALTHTPLRVAHTMYDYYKGLSIKYGILLPVVVPIYSFLEKRAWKHIKYAIVLSEEVKKRLIDYGLIGEEKILTIGPHVDYSKIKRSRKSDKLIFYGSRFTSYKRQDLAIEAFRLSKLPSLGFKLVLGGFIEDQKYFEKIQNMVSDDDNIIIKANLSEEDLRDTYSKCYATLFMAVNEDTGLVPLESLAYGKPVISVDEGGPKEFIKSGANGLLVSATPHDVAAALNRIADKKFYSKLKRGAETSTVYDKKRMIKRFDDAISQIVSSEKVGKA